jgi:hypothetical protein
VSIKLFVKTESKKGVNKDIVKVTWGAMNNAGRIFYSQSELLSVEDFLKYKELFAACWIRQIDGIYLALINGRF